MRRFLATVIASLALGGQALACDATLPGNVRVMNCRLATDIARAASRSGTLSEILARIEHTDGLVYIADPPKRGAATHLLGGLSHKVTLAGPYRVLWIFVSDNQNDRTIAIVGHELRHALEVLELSNAAGEAEVEALFDRIGWHTSEHIVETQSAVDTGYAIERELKTAHTRGSSNDELAA